MKNTASWFKGIKGKLLLSAMVPFVGFALSGYVTYNGISQLNKLLTDFYKEITPNIESIYELREARNKFGFRSMTAIASIKQNLDPQEDLSVAQTSLEDYKQALKDYQEASFMPEEERLFNDVKEDFSKVVQLMEKTYALIETKDPKNVAEAEQVIMVELPKLSKSVGAYTDTALKMYHDRAVEEGKLASTTTASVNLWTFLIIGLATTLALALSILAAIGISKSLSSIASRLGVASGSVTAAVVQLSSAGNALSQSSTEAAASLEETVASLEEMSSMVQMNSDNAKQAAALSASSREAAEKGQQEIESLITAMSEIAQSSKKIEEIISVIDDIAFQTNLLALNASVEAARAGEQGKGFAVVADAVRALAQRSADAAKDITHLIKDSVNKVDQGGRIAGQSGTVLNNIVTSVKKVADLNTEIASASAEQTAGIQQISKAMNQLDQASQSNAASAEEIAATSGEISNLAITSQNLTEELQQVINGMGKVETTPAPEKVAEEKTFAPKAVSANKAAKVIPLQTPAKVKKSSPAKTQAQEMIPFDDDGDSRSKVGTTDGF